MENFMQLIDDLEQFNTWIEELKTVEESLFFEPIAEGKWSPAEIISHITYWDKYILEETLPKMESNADIQNIDFDSFNKKAAEYALSGVSVQHLLNSQIESRNNLVLTLREKTEEDFFASFTIDGEEIDQYSGYPNTMYSYFASFVWHDNHHKGQVEQFLSKKV